MLHELHEYSTNLFHFHDNENAFFPLIGGSKDGEMLKNVNMQYISMYYTLNMIIGMSVNVNLKPCNQVLVIITNRSDVVQLYLQAELFGRLPEKKGDKR